jgi:hypothetical protein
MQTLVIVVIVRNAGADANNFSPSPKDSSEVMFASLYDFVAAPGNAVRRGITTG